MLTARNFVALTIIIAVVSLAWACFELTRPPDSGGMGGDSYGTRLHGQRGLFDVLADLGVPVERALGPPTAVLGREVTLVLWKPQPDVVQVEPAYLGAVGRWVEDGGRVVVAPEARRAAPERPRGLSRRKKPVRESTALGELGLPAVQVKKIDLGSPERDPKANSTGGPSEDRASEPSSDEDEAKADDGRRLRELLTGTARPVATRAVTVSASGVLSSLGGLVSTIEVPEKQLQVLDVGTQAPEGTLTFRDAAGKEQVLAAAYRRGKGEIVVVASPAIAENGLIARRDNSVLAVRLLAVGRPVVFDEFYHGLTIRGNPLWLFTQRGYAATTLALLTLLGLWMWREAVYLGPPLAPRAAVRRSIGEYVDAMARFLNRGGSSQAFLLREVRAGVLQAVRDELHLPPSRDGVEELAAVLARRDRGRARELVEAVGAVDAALSKNRVLKDSVAVDLYKRMTRCL